ncbi:MAG: phenylalanine--tRNA ligase subunit beta [Nitrospinae bacterium]|nr:phenylalanine--tRNA ligase subunit beta [Nitrospinota bacterium]
MKIVLDWLKDYVDIGLSTEKLGHVLTMGGLEIESEEWVELPGGGKTEVLELNVTPNRGYCLSHIGVAREVASLLDRERRLPSPDDEVEKVQGAGPVAKKISAVIEEPALCPRYALMVVENVTPGPSPAWLAERLLAVGLRPINNIVDITNYVMMEYGQPLHAFDLSLLSGPRIVVRRARANEPFVALDGSELKLGTDALVIADADKPVALAGIMGGVNSQISPDSKTVALESACFDPSAVRKASKKYGLRSDSSYRFERGVDIEGVIAAQSRAALLVRELAGGTICAGRIDLYPAPRDAKPVLLRVSRVNKILGNRFSRDRVENLLRRLGMQIEKAASADEIQVRVPSYRPTLCREIDLVEEVARLNGYDNIEVARPSAALNPAPLSSKQTCARKIRETLCHIGFSETVNYSFLEGPLAEEFKSAMATSDAIAINLSNPISADLGTMRASLVPSLLKTAARNLSKGQKPVKIFELGNSYLKTPQHGDICEKTCFAALVTGAHENSVWKDHSTTYGFYDLKGALETVVSQLKLDLEYRPVRKEFLAPGRAVECLASGRSVGYLGELSPKQIRGWELGPNAAVFEVDLAGVIAALPGTARFASIPKFPETYRDISILVDKSAPSKSVADLIGEAGSPLISKVELYDCFEGKKLPEGKKSLTFALAFQSAEKTLADDEVNPVFENIVNALREKYGASLRTA